MILLCTIRLLPSSQYPIMPASSSGPQFQYERPPPHNLTAKVAIDGFHKGSFPKLVGQKPFGGPHDRRRPRSDRSGHPKSRLGREEKKAER